MRICSLLPSVTEILFELGVGDEVVGVTHECDWPPQARTRPHLTRSRIRGSDCSSAEIDQRVRDLAGSLYKLNADLLATLKPDLILTQSLCPVCAVDETEVRRQAETLPNRPRVLSFHPTCLADVYRMFATIGANVGASAAAEQIVERFRSEVQTISAPALRRGTRRNVVLLEWTDPPFACGHWTPELIDIAGGRELLGRAGQPSRRVSWHDLCDADPDAVVVAPCGFDLERTLSEFANLARRAEWNRLRAVRAGAVFATDGSAYFNRPGPRLIDSLQILAEVLQPESFTGLAPAGSLHQVLPAGRRVH